MFLLDNIMASINTSLSDRDPFRPFPAGVSVIAQTVFNAIVNEVCGSCINNVFSIMADTTSLIVVKSPE